MICTEAGFIDRQAKEAAVAIRHQNVDNKFKKNEEANKLKVAQTYINMKMKQFMQKTTPSEVAAVKLNRGPKPALGGQTKTEKSMLAGMRTSEAKRKSKDRKRGSKEAKSRDVTRPDASEATPANPFNTGEASTTDRRWNDTQISQEV
jgi:hypothetical protein